MTKISDERLAEMLGAWRDDSRRAARGHGMNLHEMEVVSALSELQSLRQLDKEQESGHIQRGVLQNDPQPARVRVRETPGAREAFDALDLADRIISQSNGIDVPKEWNRAYRKVAKARQAPLRAALTAALVNP